jgi:anthranilate synthase component 2
MDAPHILLIDNFDSFSFNLVDAFASAGADVEIYRNTISADKAMAIAESKNSALIVLSPGPGSPDEAGCCIELIQHATGRIPIFGVCLGHQAMVRAFGGTVGSAGAIMHGKKSRIRHTGHPLFANLPTEFDVGRYHSLMAHRMPPQLQSIADCGEIVMAIAHRTELVFGVQFHPESILTTFGQTILTNLMTIIGCPERPVRKGQD